MPPVKILLNDIDTSGKAGAEQLNGVCGAANGIYAYTHIRKAFPENVFLWLGESIQASNISFDVTLDTPLHINMFSPNALKLIPSSVTAVEQLAPFGRV